MLLNVRESRVAISGDSFNSLEHVYELAFRAVATVLRFLYKRLQSAKHGTLPRQF